MEEKQVGKKTQLIVNNRGSFFSRFGLPLLLILSFAWLNLYSFLVESNDVFGGYMQYGSITTYLFVTVAFLALVEYLIFELLFFIYRVFLSFSIYSFMIPKSILINKFRMWFCVRNVVLGFVFNLRFFFPYINAYLCVFELIMNFAFIMALYLDLKREHIEPLVGQYVFRTLVLPVVLYEIYVMITLMVGVL